MACTSLIPKLTCKSHFLSLSYSRFLGSHSSSAGPRHFWDRGPAEISKFSKQHRPSCGKSWICNALNIDNFVLSPTTTSPSLGPHQRSGWIQILEISRPELRVLYYKNFVIFQMHVTCPKLPASQRRYNPKGKDHNNSSGQHAILIQCDEARLPALSLLRVATHYFRCSEFRRNRWQDGWFKKLRE